MFRRFTHGIIYQLLCCRQWELPAAVLTHNTEMNRDTFQTNHKLSTNRIDLHKHADLFFFSPLQVITLWVSDEGYMWTSLTCFAKRDVDIMVIQRGMACAPSAGGRNTSVYGRNRSRMTGLWQKSKPGLLQCWRLYFRSFTILRRATVLQGLAFSCETCTASLSVYWGFRWLNGVCHLRQAAARGGSSLRH